MDGAKIKNIIIMILLLLNLCLLVFVLEERLESKSAGAAAVAEIVRVFENRGISIKGNLPEIPKAYNSYVALRDLALEKRLAESVLGAVSASDLGGNIYYYESEKGMAQFRGNGEFEIYFNGEFASASKDSEAEAAGILKQMGVEASSLSSELSGDRNRITATASMRGAPVYNCRINFDYYENTLTAVSGRRLPDKITLSSGSDMLSASTVLMRFLDIIDKEGEVCSEIRGAELGYMLRFSISGDGNLTPVWRIVTDIYEYYVNGITGERELN